MRDLVSDEVRLRLKQATRVLVASLGGVTDAAALTGLSHGAISRAQSPDHPDLLPLDVLVYAEIRAGRPIVTAILADLTGHALRPLAEEDAAPPCEAEAAGLVLGLVGASADAARALAGAAADGVICPREARAVDGALQTAADAISLTRRRLGARLKPASGAGRA